MSENRFNKLEIKQQKVQHQEYFNELRNEDYYLKQAYTQVLLGEHEKALRIYTSALGENPLCSGAWLGQSKMLMELQEYKEAVMWADKALEKFPQSQPLWSIKAICCYRSGKKGEAQYHSDFVMQSKGECPEMWLCRGEMILGNKNVGAEECFEHALKNHHEEQVYTMIHIGQVYHRYQQYSSSFLYLQKAIQSSPKTAWAWYLLGNSQKECGQWQQAKISYSEAYKLHPSTQYQNAMDEKMSLWESYKLKWKEWLS